LRREEEVEAAGLEEDLDAMRLEDRTPRLRRTRRRRGTRTVWGCMMRGWG
jgi:hypothetical protein